jgi:large subunit ribosomal protein L15
MRLNEIRDNPGATKSRKRVGRGIGSGTGKTAGRGQKGQKSRSGGAMRVGFEGGQMPLYRRLPKRGFKNPSRREFAEINVGALQKAVDAGKLDTGGEIDEAALGAAGLFKRRRDGVRLLGSGELSAKLTLKVTGASRSAIAAVEKAGGGVTVTGAAKAPAGAADSDASAKTEKSEKTEGGAKAAAAAKSGKAEKAATSGESAKGEKTAKSAKSAESEKKEPEDGGGEAPTT